MRSFQTNYIIFLAFTLLLICCGENGRRKKELEKKEQQLKVWEQQLSLREQALIKKEYIIDSLNSYSDTAGVFDPKLVGDWKMTMVCTETTCEGSAIGDTKTEHWNISYQNNRVVARVIANKQLIRHYSGFFKENTLELTADQAPESEAQMRVVLNPNPAITNLMEGQRVINQGGKCKIVYQLKAEKL
jgi:hypothetical protein